MKKLINTIIAWIQYQIRDYCYARDVRRFDRECLNNQRNALKELEHLYTLAESNPETHTPALLKKCEMYIIRNYAKDPRVPFTTFDPIDYFERQTGVDVERVRAFTNRSSSLEDALIAVDVLIAVEETQNPKHYDRWELMYDDDYNHNPGITEHYPSWHATHERMEALKKCDQYSHFQIEQVDI